MEEQNYTYSQCVQKVNVRDDIGLDDESARIAVIDTDCKGKILKPLIGTKQITTLMDGKYEVMLLRDFFLQMSKEDTTYFSENKKLQKDGETVTSSHNYVFKLLELTNAPEETPQQWKLNKKLEEDYEEEIKAALKVVPGAWESVQSGGRKRRKSRRKTRRGGKRRLYRVKAVKAWLKRTRRRRKKKKTKKKKKKRRRRRTRR
jgi:hypothetical protein